MAEEKNTLVEKKEKFSDMMMTSLNEIEEGLPDEFNKLRFVANAVALLNDNDGLREFAQKPNGMSQIKLGLLKCAYLNLDASQNEAYLIPYGAKLQFMPSYRGYIKLAQRYSIRPVKDIYAKVVRRGDLFKEKIVEGQPTIDFDPLPFNDDDIIGAFAVCLFHDGGMQYDVMSLKELEQTRKASKMSRGPAWTQYTAEMYKKVVIRRMLKGIQMNFDSPMQSKYFNEDTDADFRDKTPKKASMNSLLVGTGDDDGEGEVVAEQ